MPFPSKYYTPVPMVDCQRMSREQWYSRRHNSRAEIRELRSRLKGMSDPGYNGSTQNRTLNALSWAKFHFPRIPVDRDTRQASGKWYDARVNLLRKRDRLKQEAQDRKWVEEALRKGSKNYANELKERAA